MTGSNTFSSLIPLIVYVFFTLAHAQDFGFSADLIHRDSVNSPSYKPFESPSQRISNAFRRSINRAKHFYPTAAFSTQTSQFDIAPTQAPQSDISPTGGAYVMKIKLGTPPMNIVAIADTGSDIIWTQCEPCISCFNQNSSIFNPSKSSTYKNLPCSADICGSTSGTQCEGNNCKYSVQYGDQSFTEGNIAIDTVALPSTSGKSVIFPKTIFGCGHENGGTFDAGSSGIIGLGGGELSLINQLGKAGRGIFSYCLVPLSSDDNSKINFGASAIVDGEEAVSTPIIKKTTETFYYLTLEGVSVGDERFELTTEESSDSQEGNVIIDSGTTLTMLPSDIYNKLESAVRKQIKQETTSDPSGQFSLCYEGKVDKFEAPTLTAHFTNANVKLRPINTFLQASKGLVCFAIIPMESIGSDVGGIIGNVAQANYLVGYDLKKMTVTFKHTNCAQNT